MHFSHRDFSLYHSYTIADRLHTNGVKALYPTFVNVGEQATAEGDGELLVIRFRARKAYVYDLQPADGLLVDKRMNQAAF